MDETNLSAQFKMLRLESCLVGEATEMVKGPGYLDHVYEATKARMNQKYRGTGDRFKPISMSYVR